MPYRQGALIVPRATETRHSDSYLFIPQTFFVGKTNVESCFQFCSVRCLKVKVTGVMVAGATEIGCSAQNTPVLGDMCPSLQMMELRQPRSPPLR